ncbi:LysM domain-containing protein [Verticillium dahliae]
MRLLHLPLPSLLCVSLTKAYLVAPPGTPAPGATQRCSGWVQSSYALSCDIIVRVIGMTLPQFQEWNPATSMMGPGCNMINGLDYCIEVDFIQYTATMTTAQSTTSSPGTTTKASTTSTTTPGNGVATPTPIQAGMTTRCKTFHQVVAGEVCFGVVRPAGISIANFFAWNPAVGTDCGALLPGYYVCVALL